MHSILGISSLILIGIEGRVRVFGLLGRVFAWCLCLSVMTKAKCAYHE